MVSRITGTPLLSRAPGVDGPPVVEFAPDDGYRFVICRWCRKYLVWEKPHNCMNCGGPQ